MIKTELEMLQLAIDNYNKDNIQTVKYFGLYDINRGYMGFLPSFLPINMGDHCDNDRQKNLKDSPVYENILDFVNKVHSEDLVDFKVEDFEDREILPYKNFLLKGDQLLTVTYKATMNSVIQDIEKYIKYHDSKDKAVVVHPHKAVHDFINRLPKDTIKQVSITTFEKIIIKSQKTDFKDTKRCIRANYMQYVDIKNIRLYFVLCKYSDMLCFYARILK